MPFTYVPSGSKQLAMSDRKYPILIERAEGSNTVPSQKTKLKETHQTPGNLLKTEPASANQNGKIRVISSLVGQGREVIGEASELTQSKSNVILGTNSVASDFARHMQAYEDCRQRLQQKPTTGAAMAVNANHNQMPFEIAENKNSSS